MTTIVPTGMEGFSEPAAFVTAERSTRGKVREAEMRTNDVFDTHPSKYTYGISHCTQPVPFIWMELHLHQSAQTLHG